MTRRPFPIPIAATLRALLAVVAVVSQLTLGALVLPDRAMAGGADPRAGIDALTLRCGAQAAAVPSRRHHRHDATRCPLPVALAQPAAILPPEPALPGRAEMPSAAPGARPGARAPPASPPHLPPARGPPIPAR